MYAHPDTDAVRYDLDNVAAAALLDPESVRAEVGRHIKILTLFESRDGEPCVELAIGCYGAVELPWRLAFPSVERKYASLAVRGYEAVANRWTDLAVHTTAVQITIDWVQDTDDEWQIETLRSRPSLMLETVGFALIEWLVLAINESCGE